MSVLKAVCRPLLRTTFKYQFTSYRMFGVPNIYTPPSQQMSVYFCANLNSTLRKYSDKKSFPSQTVHLRCYADHTPPQQEIVSELGETEYEHICEETLDSLAEMFDGLPDIVEISGDYDVVYGAGVLTVKLGAQLGTYVINKQTPNRQIWLSSPVSGPKRYDFIDGQWIYKHDGVALHHLLSQEMSQTFNGDVDFTTCSYGRAGGSSKS